MTTQTKYTIDELRQACINDYAKLCYDDGGTLSDECSLEQYKINIAAKSFDELVKETWYIADHPEHTVDSYVECFLPQTQFKDLKYKVNPDGSTILQAHE